MTYAAIAEPAVFRAAPTDVTEAIRTASAKSGVSFSYLMTKAATESGFRADAKAPTSSATGLFQFIERTWLSMVREHGDKFGLGHYADALEEGNVSRSLRREILDLRNDPETAALMAAQYACENKAHLERRVGGDIGSTELYLAHFLGAGGASKFLNAWRADPDRDAASLMPDAARANRNIFYGRNGARSLDQVYQHFAAKFGDCDPAPAVYAQAAAPGQVAQDGWQGGWRADQPAAAAKPPNVMSPSSYAARIFLASLSVPGEAAPPAAPGGIPYRSS